MNSRQENKLISILPDENREFARKGLLAFTKYTKPDYEVSWHHRELCKFLNKFLTGKIKRGMIFMPPRHGKSELVSRRLPALLHGLHPSAEIMAATYNSELASDMAIDVQRIMDRPEYRELFPDSRITPEGTLSKYARNALEHELIPITRPDGSMYYPEGSYRAAGIGGSFTGRGANYILIDDPVKGRADADSKTFRDNVWKFYTSALYTRLEKNGSILLTMTRWHEDDLAGRLLRLAKSDPEADQWEVLSFPAIREDLDNTKDPRLLGEPLWPEKYDLAALNKNRKMGTRDWDSLFQQKPNAEDGNIFKAPWFKYYKVVPPKFDQLILSFDFATKDKSGSDYTVGQAWGRVGSNKYLLGQVRGRYSFPVACQKVLELKKAFPAANKILIEAKANGPAVKQTLSAHVSGIVEVEPRGDKVARANAISPEVEGGNVWFPHPELAPWINDYVSEMCSFPHGTNDDQVDATTQALDELRKAFAFYAPTAGHGMGVVYGK